MGKFFDRIFRRKYYKYVKSTYSEVLVLHTTAFNMFIKKKQITPDDSYEFQEYIVEHYDEIRRCSREIQTAQELFSYNHLGFCLFCREENISNPRNAQIKHHRLVYKNRELIINYDKQAKKYESIKQKYSNAIKELFDTATADTIGEIEKRLSQLEEIKKINSILKSYAEIEKKYKNALKYHYKKCKLKEFSEKEDAVAHRSELLKTNNIILKVEAIIAECPRAWKLFQKTLGTESLYDMSIDILQDIKKDVFRVKEQYLFQTRRFSKSKINLISPKEIDVNQFTTLESKCELKVIEILNNQPKTPKSSFNCTIPNPERDQYARVILHSKRYGSDVKFSDEFTIEQFYSLLRTLKGYSTDFDVVASQWAYNSEAIKKYNLQRTGKEILYIDDLVRLASKDSEMMQFIDNYNKMKRQREEDIRKEREKRERENVIDRARSLARSYSKGFEHFFPDKSIYSIDYPTAQSILWKESQIKEWSSMLDRISSWNEIKGIPYYFFWYYYPTRFGKVSDESERARKIVWNFKDGETTDISIASIVVNKLKETFNRSMLNKFTFVCIPASSRLDNEIRYETFSSEVCTASGMKNAFSYIGIVKEKTPKHLSPTHLDEPAEYSFDNVFFKGANIILFDDVITTGRSMAAFKRVLESLGATVICAISIGRTYSDYYGDNRKPHPYTGTL